MSLAREELTRLNELREQLATGYHEPPPAPHTRDAVVREKLDGVPLWRLWDFKPETDGALRAGIEAAMEAAGLLDAWVTPYGRLLDPGTHDTVIALVDTPCCGPHLGELLRPEIDAENPYAARISSELTTSLLKRIGFGRNQGSAWVDGSGNWRVGPLHGHWSTARAEHIGQSARDVRRRRRLREVEAHLLEIRTHIETLERALDQLKARRLLLDRELAALPDHGPLRQAVAATVAARE